MLKLRATRITSLIAGIIFGTTLSLIETDTSTGTFLVFAMFLLFMVFAVIGIPQYREAQQEVKRRGLDRLGGLLEQEDFAAFYLPTWGRMFLYFCGTVAGALLTKALVA